MTSKDPKKEQSYLKGNLTKVETWINKHVPANVNRERYDMMQTKLQSVNAPLTENHLAILSTLTDQADIDNQNSEQQLIDDRVLVLEEFISDCLTQLKAKEKQVADKAKAAEIIATANAQAAAAAASNPRPTTTSVLKVAKLPEIQLPKFSGRYEDWLTFSDRFKNVIHNRPDLPGSEKLKYLQGALQGDSAKIIQNVTISDANYLPAWDAIEKKYQHTREIVFNLLDKIFDHPDVMTGSVSSLESLFMDMNNAHEAIKSLKRLPNLGEDMMIRLFLRKMDGESRNEFKKSLSGTDVPSWTAVADFVHKVVADNASEDEKTYSSKPITPSVSSHPARMEKKGGQRPGPSPTCSFCKASHRNYECIKLKEIPAAERLTFAKEHKVCTNCLSPGHATKDCKSEQRCFKCQGNHHSLLHKDVNRSQTKQSPASALTAQTTSNSHTMLATAEVQIRNQYDQQWNCRALIDTGSTHTFINSSLVRTLGLSRKLLSNPLEVKGLSEKDITTVTHQVNLDISTSYSPDTLISTTAFIVEKVSGVHPRAKVDSTGWKHLSGLRLADPEFQKCRGVDLLFGADLYPRIIRGGIVKGPSSQPMAQDSTFGWIVLGPAPSAAAPVSVCMNSTCALEQTMKKFWEIEECPSIQRLLSPQDLVWEKHFHDTTIRRDDGSYEVQLPFKPDIPALGNSKNMALRRFYNLEQKLEKDKNLKKLYHAKIKGMLDAGHMELVPADEVNVPDSKAYYLPHHPVIKESSSTTQLRIVFDGSAKTTSGRSLNEGLMVGPVRQQELFHILVRFRWWLVPMQADIKEMYLNVWMRICDRNFQRIFWRFGTEEHLKVYRLTKVIFGASSAPAQAIEVLIVVAQRYANEYPLASKVTQRDFYVDDCITGENSVQRALQLQHELIELCSKAHFLLRKWSSAAPEVLEAVPEEMRETHLPLSLDKESSTKALGLIWHPAQDEFAFIAQPPKSTKITKRIILSETSRVFDPLGLLSPVTIRAKVLMQRLWAADLQWDVPVPGDVKADWTDYQNDIKAINNLRIPRWISQEGANLHQLHGFADASTKAYGAVVYLRTSSSSGKVSVQLIASKSRVAPLKATSIPRLELCAAELLANLMVSVRQALPTDIPLYYGWTDSTITLHWIRASTQKQEVFVANRVTKITLRIPSDSWYHVPGILNPADLPSRGISAQELLNNSLWFQGPPFLHELNSNPETISLPKAVELPLEVPKGDAYTPSTATSILPHQLVDSARGDPKEDAFTSSTSNSPHTNKEDSPQGAAVHSATLQPQKSEFISRYSSWSQLQRHTCWWIRAMECSKSKPRIPIPMSPLSIVELRRAQKEWIGLVQNQVFQSEILEISKGRNVPSTSPLFKLSPWIDPKDGLLKVGGRLENAKLPVESKTPVVLPRHHLAIIIVRHYHNMYLHAGPQLLWYMLRQQFFIIRGMKLVRAVVKGCKVCRLHRAQPLQQLMADLPEPRVTVSRPFSKVGIDYAGPLNIRTWAGRGAKQSKSYIAIFVCFATKAVHIELVSSLSSEAFIAALRRFVARRGRPSDIYSDNGTNFVAADKDLQEFFQLLKAEQFNQKISKHLSEKEIQWHFNPPAAPHMGGLWEAAVKSTKFHLKRIMGSAHLTFEELYTVLLQVEACLNSRPLCPDTSHPDEIAALTPGHFLIGEALLAVPDPDLQEVQVNRLSRFQHCQQMVQHFWNRWSKEYLQTLQKRNKWNILHPNIHVGEVVAVIEDNLPPQRWKLAVVTEVHINPTDKKDIIRTVTVKTAEGQYKRPITKLCKIPTEDEDEIHK